MGTVNEHGHECWIVETSKDGERWRFFGKAWKQPGEQILLHAVPRYVRFRPEWEKDWSEPLERTSDLPMTLLLMETGARSELWPDAGHVGLPMLLPHVVIASSVPASPAGRRSVKRCANCCSRNR